MNFINLFLVFIFIISIILYNGSYSLASNNQEILNNLGTNREGLSLERKSTSLDSISSGLNYKTSNIVGIVNSLESKDMNLIKNLKDLQAEETEHEVKIQIKSDVLFDFDSSVIHSEAEKTLAKIADIIKKYKNKEVIVSGHTDSKGSDSYNQELSEQRAKSVQNFFVSKSKIPKEIFKIKGYGESQPIAPNTMQDGKDNPEGRQKNRRVEIIIKK